LSIGPIISHRHLKPTKAETEIRRLLLCYPMLWNSCRKSWLLWSRFFSHSKKSRTSSHAHFAWKCWLCVMDAPCAHPRGSPQSSRPKAEGYGARIRELFVVWCVVPVFFVSEKFVCSRQLQERWSPPASERTGGLERLLGRPQFNYEPFNSSSVNIRSWSWNYRGCWHQTCPPIVTRYSVDLNTPHWNLPNTGWCQGGLFLFTASPVFRHWAICAPAALRRSGSHFSGSLSGIEP